MELLQFHGLMYLLILCVLGVIAISYLQRRLVAATDHCCACKQLVLAPRRLTRMTPSFVRSAVCSLPSLFASIVLRMYYTSQVKVMKVAVPSYERDKESVNFTLTRGLHYRGPRSQVLNVERNFRKSLKIEGSAVGREN